VVDLALAQDAHLDQRLYSVSRRLAESRNDYYAELAVASRGGLDITRWLLWFVGQLEAACRASEDVLDLSLAKARFWLEHAEASLTDRQRKVVNRMLHAGPGGFEGGMSTSKYEHLAGVSRATAYRDLEELVRHRLLAQTGTGGVRGTTSRGRMTDESPALSLDARDRVKMLVAAQNRQSVLQGKRRDPRVVGRNRCAALFEPDAQRRVCICRLFGHRKNVEMPQLGLQPLLIRRAVSRLGDPITKFSKHDDRDARSRLIAQYLAYARIAIDERRQRVGIEYHNRSSGSIPSNPSSITP
jgi:hypothetical protein